MGLFQMLCQCKVVKYLHLMLQFWLFLSDSIDTNIQQMMTDNIIYEQLIATIGQKCRFRLQEGRKSSQIRLHW